MTWTAVLRSPFILLALICESLAGAFRAAAWLIRLPDPSANRDEGLSAPLGYWRCTHSIDSFKRSFTPGGVYRAIPLPAGSSSIRVIPANYNCWAPYWDKLAQRFCYQADELDFEYLGPKLPSGATCLSS